MQKANEIFAEGFLADAFPILGYLPNSDAKFLVNLIQEFEMFVLQIVQERKETFDPGNVAVVPLIYWHIENLVHSVNEQPGDDQHYSTWISGGPLANANIIWKYIRNIVQLSEIFIT